MIVKRRVAALTTLWRAVRASRRPGAPGIGAQLSAVPRMIAASLSGRYPHLAKGRIALALLGVLYVVSPLDVMPEILLGVFGVGDDALVTAWVVGALLGETERFLLWEAERGRVVVGQVVR
jgi:uncharacterized membrane protein YkvA (DUF1232 family)